MSIPESIAEKMSQALEDGDADLAEEAALEALSAGCDPLEVISEVMIPALTEVGNQFQSGEIFLPELMMAGEAAGRVSKHMEAAIASQGRAARVLGTVVLGTVQGDIHDIGKNILATLLRAHGFKVHDLGRNVAPSAFLDAAREHNADIVGMSSLMTTTRPNALNTLNLFQEVGVRDAHRIIIGGGSVTEDWVKAIGADGYAPDAAAAVDLCKRLVGAAGS